MLYGIFDNWEMVDWPDHALAAVWEMTQHKRYHYVRTGGRFATWRKELKAANENRAGNHRPPKSAFVPRPGQCRFLARVNAKIRGKRVPALLYERPVEDQRRGSAGRVYSTASRVTTQETANICKALQLDQDDHRKSPLKAIRNVLRTFPQKIAAKLVRLGGAIVRRLRV